MEVDYARCIVGPRACARAAGDGLMSRLDKGLILIRSAFAAVLMLMIVLGACILISACSVTPTECADGYSWRGDCAQQLYK